MPQVNISLRTGTAPEYRKAVADSIHQAMIDALGIPEDDRFELISELHPENVHQHPTFFGIERGAGSIFIQIVINVRPLEQKRDLYRGIVERLADDPGVAPQDIFIGVVEVAPENWWAHARP